MGRILVLKAGVFAVFAASLVAGPRAAAATLTASGEPVMAVATFAGIDPLRQDLDLIGKLGEVPGLRSMLEGLVAVQTGGRGLAGIDAARPWGVIVLGSEPRTMILVPCSNVNALSDTLAKIGRGRSTDLGDGSFEMELPGNTCFIRQSGDYAFVAQTNDELDDLPANPDELFDGLERSYDVAARINWQAVPAEVQEQVIEQVRTSLGQNLLERGEWNEEVVDGTATAEDQLERAIMWLERTDTITLGWRLDEAAQKAFVDLTWQAIEGHHAEEFADFLHAEPTRFAGFVDSAATMKLNVTLGPLTSDDALCLGDALEQFKQNAATSPSSGATEAQRQAEQQAVNEIADVVLQTAAEEGIDVAMSVFAKNQQVTVVLAADIADDERVERALERLSEAKDLPNVEWNHSTIGDVRCHRIAIDSNDIGPTGNKPEGILGFGPRSLYFAVGHEAEAALTRALETSNRTAASSLPPVHFTLSISDAIQHAPDAGRLDVLKAIWQDFPTKDHLNVSLQPVERGARIRIELEEGVVAALSKSIGVGIQQGFTSAGAGR